MFAFSPEAYAVETTVNLNIVYWQRTIADRIAEQIDLHYTDKAEDGYRSHLGWSVIGAPCLRYLYYHWHWFDHEIHQARMERIFIEGHKIENELRHIMRERGAIFYDNVDTTGEQIHVSDLGGHFGGSCDGIFTWPSIGIVESMLLECKSSNTASFNELAKKSVLGAKPQHYVQQCGYGYKLGIKYGCYITRNKNDSRLYIEIIPLDWSLAEENTRKAQFIILSNQVPPRISNKRNFWLCNMCSYQGVCHDNKPPTKTCRNCIHCKPIDNAQFQCNLYNVVIPNKKSLINGCSNHQILPG